MILGNSTHIEEGTLNTTFFYRPVRRMLEEAMREVEQFDSIIPLAKHVCKLWPEVAGTVIKIEETSGRPDTRIGWDESLLVMVDGTLYGNEGYIPVGHVSRTPDDYPEDGYLVPTE